MDKTDFRNKRRQDKQHRKAPPPKPGKQTVTPKVPEVQHTAPLVVCDQRYSKRKIQQNWTEDRDLPSEESESEDEQLNAADFEKLLTVPASTGGHFLLSSEKHWLAPETGLPGEEDQRNSYSEFFRIDTKLLNAGLASIPFYERLGYDECLFNAAELNAMRCKADIQAEAYKMLCNEHDTQCRTVPVTVPRKPVPCLVGKFALPEKSHIPLDSNTKPEEALPPTTDAVPIKPVESKMSALKLEAPVNVVASSSNAKLPVKPAIATQPAKKETKEDIQQWLDDILDI